MERKLLFKMMGDWGVKIMIRTKTVPQALFILVGFLTVFLVVSSVAWADVLIPSDGNTYQNTAQNPCVIYGPGNCTNPAGWEELGNTQGDFDLMTQTGANAAGDHIITMGELRTALGLPSNSTVSFLLGVDLNEDSNPQTNLVLQVFIGAVYYYEFSQTSITTTNQGTGWADYVGALAYSAGVFTPIQIPASVSDSEQIQFHFALNSSDGADQLFLIRGAGETVNTPEPTTLLLLGMGLLGVGFASRKRK